MLIKAIKRFMRAEDGALAIDWFAISTGVLGLGAITTAAVVGTMAANPAHEAKPASATATSASNGTWRPMALDADEVQATILKAASMEREDLERMKKDLLPYARAEVVSDMQTKRLADTFFIISAELAKRSSN
ncbi:hypothetical protein [Frigidibacter sp. MR17.24]|uniref:hypothetical protein n=1 Tax=Frigidibacter sp. MR17.24 TaxID=3127345 RepID=UPI003013112F